MATLAGHVFKRSCGFFGICLLPVPAQPSKNQGFAKCFQSVEIQKSARLLCLRIDRMKQYKIRQSSFHQFPSLPSRLHLTHLPYPALKEISAPKNISVTSPFPMILNHLPDPIVRQPAILLLTMKPDVPSGSDPGRKQNRPVETKLTTCLDAPLPATCCTI